jgi:hypothetical protein
LLQLLYVLHQRLEQQLCRRPRHLHSCALVPSSVSDGSRLHGYSSANANLPRRNRQDA